LRRRIGHHRDHAATGAQRRLEACQYGVAAVLGHRHLHRAGQVLALARAGDEVQVVVDPFTQAEGLRRCRALALQRHARSPLGEERLVLQAADDEQVAVGVLRHVGRTGHRHAQGRVAGRVAELAQQRQVGFGIGRAGLVGQHHRRLGQVGQAGEGEAAVGIGRQLGHGHVVRELRDVDGRGRVDRAAHVVQQRLAVAGCGLEVVVHAQLAARAQRQRRQQHLALLGDHAVGQQLGRERVPPTVAARVRGAQRQRADEAVVDAHVERRLVVAHPRRVAVVQVERDAARAPGEQVRRHLQVDLDHVRRIAAHVEVGRLRQLAELDRAVACDPARGVVRLARGNVLQARDGDAGAGEGACVQRERGGGAAQFAGVAAHYQQQLARGVLRVVDHRDRRAGDGRQREAGDGGLGRGEHHGVGRGQGIARHREGRAAVARERAEPRRHDARHFERGRRRRAAEDKGNARAAHVAPVEEGLRQHRKVARGLERHDVQPQRARRVDLGPQAAVLRVFAFARVVADQLDVDAVEVGDEAAVDRDVGGLRLAGAVARQRDRRHQHVVHAHLQVRQLGDECRRVGVVQPQAGAGDQFVRAHAERDADGTVHTAQLDGVVETELGQREFAGGAGGCGGHGRRSSGRNGCRGLRRGRVGGAAGPGQQSHQHRGATQQLRWHRGRTSESGLHHQVGSLAPTAACGERGAAGRSLRRPAR
jgi:hypothetical protein